MRYDSLKEAVFSVAFLKRIIMGFVIGVASVTPGLSGGVLAVAAGLYEPALRAIVNIKREFLKSAAFLFPLGVGGVLGILTFSRVMKELMAYAEYSVLFAFLGLVVGSFPSLIKEANGEGFKKRYLLVAVLAFVFVVTLGVLSEWQPGEGTQAELSIIIIIVSGAVLAFGTVIPGISSSFILMYMGIYESLLDAIVELNISILVWLAVGFAIVALLIIKLVEILFRRFHGYSYYAVTGFLVGSMVMVFPGFRSGWNLVLDLLIFLLSAFTGYAAMGLGARQDNG